MGQLKDETTRRSFLKVGVAAAAALGMSDLFGATAQAAPDLGVAPTTLRSGPAGQQLSIVDSHCHATPVWTAAALAISWSALFSPNS